MDVCVKTNHQAVWCHDQVMKRVDDGGHTEASHGTPELASLCTKCAKPQKKIHGTKIPGGYILASKSFSLNVPGTRKNDNLSNVSLPRASIVKQEVILEGGLQEIYDLPSSQLGKGSYGSVGKAVDKATGQTRAVKTVYKPKIENIARLKREILIMKNLDHPNIIRLFEVYEDDKHLYLIMELCQGGELFDRIVKSGHLSERYAATIMRQVFSAVAYAHSLNILHRDLKPENLLFADPSPVSPLKVIAPEVLYGNYTHMCDLWSAGVILYILLSDGKENREILEKVKTGNYSFDSRAWTRISDWGKDLVRRLLTYDPRRRITAHEALQHPWVQYYNQPSQAGESPLSNRLGIELINKFKLFRKAAKLKQLALEAVAYQLSETDITTLHNLFSRIDKKAAGLLPKKDLENALKEMGIKITEDVQALIDDIDVDGDGAIEYSEFIAACLDHKFYEQEAVCRSAFKVFDLDGDGKITTEELSKVLNMNFIQGAFSQDDVEALMREIDTDSANCIRFDEFMSMMRGQQKKKMDAVGGDTPDALTRKYTSAAAG